MKKFKSVATSLLSLLLSGTMLFSVGCDDDNKGGNTSQEVVASQEVKTEFFNGIENAFASLGTNPEQIVKLTMDLDLEITEKDYNWDETTDEVIETIVGVSNNTYDGTAYLQMKNESLTLDAWLNGEMKDDQGTTYGYADIYIRGDDIYAGVTDSSAKITDADKAAIEYAKESLSELLGSLMGGSSDGEGYPDYNGDGNSTVDPNAPEFEIDSNVGTMSATSTEETTEEPSMEEMLKELEPLIKKALENVVSGLSATLKTEGKVQTLTFDFKKEAQGIVDVMKTLANSITNGMTMSQFLNNKALEDLFNKYLGTLTATELATVIGIFMADPPAPAAGVSGYKYLIDTICAMPDEITGKTIGEQTLDSEMKAEMLESVAEAEAELAEINALKFAIRATDGKFSGIAFDIDIKDDVDLYFSLNVETVVSYNFKDVTTLTLAQATEKGDSSDIVE